MERYIGGGNDGGKRGPQVKGCRHPPAVEKSKEMDFPLEFPEGMNPVNTLTF